MSVSGVTSNPAPKAETATKSLARESNSAEVDKSKIRAKETLNSRANQQLNEIGTNVNIAV